VDLIHLTYCNVLWFPVVDIVTNHRISYTVRNYLYRAGPLRACQDELLSIKGITSLLLKQK
jgi:hypothetical protein